MVQAIPSIPAPGPLSHQKAKGGFQKGRPGITSPIASKGLSSHPDCTREDAGSGTNLPAPKKSMKLKMPPSSSHEDMPAVTIGREGGGRAWSPSRPLRPPSPRPATTFRKRPGDSNTNTRSTLQESSKKSIQTCEVVKVIPVSGEMNFPEIPLKVGTATWKLLYLNLANWLPELADIEDENSIMLQYKADNGWKPLAGDDQLKNILEGFSKLGWCLHIRCAPQDEFESGSEKAEDHLGSGVPGSGRKNQAKPVCQSDTHHPEAVITDIECRVESPPFVVKERRIRRPHHVYLKTQLTKLLRGITIWQASC